MKTARIGLLAAAAWLGGADLAAAGATLGGTFAPAQQARGIAATALQLRQLDGVKRVLMIGAHPDDEDTSLLAALARGMGAETAYLSLSRGEGGQNLIGPRLHEGLGIVRTGELLAARALDGGEQFFARAFDFGYSKSLDEALSHWSMDEVLRDVVFVVRQFRPHVIVSVFSGTRRDGHGQHQISGLAALEAFDAAGDPDRFPELASRGVEPWSPAKLYRSVRFSPDAATLRVATGRFDPVLGRSHFQLAMESRSRHRSQDMGAGQYMGTRDSPLELLASRPARDGDDAEDGIFAGVDTTLAGQLHERLGTNAGSAPREPSPGSWVADARARLGAYREAVAEARQALDGFSSDGVVAPLLRGAAVLGEVADGAPPGAARDVLTRRLAQVSEAALSAAGVVVEVRADRGLWVPGESVVLEAIVWNGGPWSLREVAPRLLLPHGWRAAPATAPAAAGQPRSSFFRPRAAETPGDGRVPPGGLARWRWLVDVPPQAQLSVPYFMEHERTGDLYAWPEESDRWARPFDPAPVAAAVSLVVEASGERAGGGPAATATEVRREVEFVGVDKASGEYREAVLVVPALSVRVQPGTMVWPVSDPGPREFAVLVANASARERSGTLRLDLPSGWRTEPDSVRFSLKPGGAGQSFAFRVAPADARSGGAAPVGRHEFRAVATDDSGTAYDLDYDVVDHPHIRRAALFGPSVAQVGAFDVIADATARVGYVMGSGDGGAEALRQMGMTVDLLDDAQVREGAFDDYDVMVLGVRAYETRPDLADTNDALLAFARSGGTVIVQYNKYEYAQGGFAPYPVRMNRPHDRVVDETAPVTLIAPNAPVLTSPNTVGPADFDGWVQERGLYFASDWDARFVPVLETADPGEQPKRGGLLAAPVGDGLYVYTGLAFFRQFPALVPGAYRLFANLASLRANDWHEAMSRRPRTLDAGAPASAPD